jgi:hypothetical protein
MRAAPSASRHAATRPEQNAIPVNMRIAVVEGWADKRLLLSAPITRLYHAYVRSDSPRPPVLSRSGAPLQNATRATGQTLPL